MSLAPTLSLAPLAFVQSIVHAAKMGDFPTASAGMSPNIIWTSNYPAHRLPFGGEVKGPDAVCRMLERMFASAEALSMEVHKVVEQEDTVIVIGVEQLRVRTTGKTFANPLTFVATLSEGKIDTMRLFGDSYAVVEALGSSFSAP